MKKIAISSTALFVALAFLAGAQALAGKAKPAAKKAAKLQTVQGEVVKLTSKKGKLTGISLKGENEKIYRVYMNAKSKKLAKEFAGKKVEVSAVLTTKGTKKKPVMWLNVKSYKAVEAPADEEPANEPAPKEEGGATEEGGVE
ncbi:MAG TPA: hypothetical protein VM425_01630 [Myxococcota bacterium]|nr:hypothetical protein [Myxococcota bacterium]